MTTVGIILVLAAGLLLLLNASIAHVNRESPLDRGASFMVTGCAGILLGMGLYAVYLGVTR